MSAERALSETVVAECDRPIGRKSGRGEDGVHFHKVTFVRKKSYANDDSDS